MKKDSSSVKEFEKNSMAYLAHTSIKKLILSGEINGKINQEKIADIFGISRTPIVIALNKLAAEGYIKQIPYKGFFVKKYTRKEISDINEARKLFERLGVEKIIENITDEKKNTLKEYIKKFRIFNKKNDVGSYRDLDIKFHNYIIQQTNNDYIMKQYSESITIPNITASFIPVEDSIKHHINIVENILSNKKDKAIKAIVEHIDALILKVS